MRNVLIALLCFTFLGGHLYVGDLSAKEKEVLRVSANNAAALKEVVGKEIVVSGKVKRTSVSKSGNHFLNFYSSDLTVICFSKDAKNFERGGPAKLWKDKEVEVSGKLELYKGKPQIKLIVPEQIRAFAKSLEDDKRKVDKRSGDKESGDKDSKEEFSLNDILVDEDGKAGGISLNDIKVGGKDGESEKPDFELKQVDKQTWLSPAGLIYKGKDAKGLTRVEHVLRHAEDQPNRAGSHGVFDGDEVAALEIVDEAWKLAKKKKIKPKKERDRLAFTIPMGRRVGYLGGQRGKYKKNPPLSKVFIVISGKSEVITAFPK